MKSKLRLSYKLIQICLHFGFGLLLAGVVFPLLNVCLSVPAAKRIRDALKVLWLRLFSRCLNLAISHEGQPHAGALIVSNHISWLDIVVLGQFTPAYFVAKSDILSWPVVGFLAKQGGTIFIRRGDKRQIKATAEQMLWVLKQHGTVIAFPEGTTTNGQEVLGFHTSLLQPALLSKAAVQPAALQYQGQASQYAPFIGDDAFVPHLLNILALPKVEVRVRFLPVINSAGKDRVTLGDEARSAIVAANQPELGLDAGVGTRLSSGTNSR